VISGFPSSRIHPRRDGTTPPRILISVDLPAPFLTDQRVDFARCTSRSDVQTGLYAREDFEMLAISKAHKFWDLLR